MTLDDAALRERAYRWCGANQTTYSEWTVDELTTAFIAIRDAARAEQREAIKGLLKACDELMTEFVSKKRAADWGVINDAMVAGAAAIHA